MKHHLKLDGREYLDQILRKMTKSETTHRQVQPCSRGREGQRSRPYVSQRKLKANMQIIQTIQHRFLRQNRSEG